ncbi:putative GMC oxidoreductase [Daldinia decipiens]|uniref:putative GMC oxidoreductase n=1 Tax=Daldinia decipiens TaxID=326647 RepID=UPI0020C27D94|nr:putative GMC oxidoreductase [Daldinia decipiens]KAI1652582.1 putative GMC oxidoreductase [Daldinia decipiens]
MSFASVSRFGFFATLLLAVAEPFAQARRIPELQLRFLNGSTQVKPSYDYVIIGAGTAGLAVADCLTADGKTTVLVIENGKVVDPPRITQGFSGTAAMGPTWSCQINSVPQVNLQNRSTAVIAGNLVGGSSAINAMMTVRGTSEDYDRWSSFFSNSSTWSWNGLLPYLKKGLTFVPPDSGAGRAGVKRSYARTGHYDGINGTNYDVVTQSHVTKILLEEGSATGVVFQQKNGNTTILTTVKANGEVIISAGAIHSPQLLRRSKIKPQKLLESAGLNTTVDLPGVGQNFQDHPMPLMSIVLRNFTTHPSPLDMFGGNKNVTDWAQELWRANKTAWLGIPLPPDTDPTVAAGYSAQMKKMTASIRSSNTAFYNHVLTGAGSSGTLVDLHPLSRGTVNIDTTDPFNTEPIVDHRALTNPVDLDIMIEMLRFTKRYFFWKILKELSPRQVQPPDYVNEPEDLAGFLAQNLSPSEFHPSGTCAMMPRELGGVVDESLKVHGVKNLRVVDASIMLSVYAIAEKAVDFIEADSQLE